MNHLEGVSSFLLRLAFSLATGDTGFDDLESILLLLDKLVIAALIFSIFLISEILLIPTIEGFDYTVFLDMVSRGFKIFSSLTGIVRPIISSIDTSQWSAILNTVAVPSDCFFGIG